MPKTKPIRRIVAEKANPKARTFYFHDDVVELITQVAAERTQGNRSQYLRNLVLKDHAAYKHEVVERQRVIANIAKGSLKGLAERLRKRDV